MACDALHSELDWIFPHCVHGSQLLQCLRVQFFTLGLRRGWIGPPARHSAVPPQLRRRCRGRLRRAHVQARYGTEMRPDIARLPRSGEFCGSKFHDLIYFIRAFAFYFPAFPL